MGSARRWILQTVSTLPVQASTGYHADDLPLHRQTQAQSDDQGRRLTSLSVGREEDLSRVLEKIAKSRGTHLTSIAFAYIMHKAPYVFPIVGGRKVSHLKGHIEALNVTLSDDETEEIEQAYAFDVGFPLNLICGPKPPRGPEDNLQTSARGKYDFVEGPKSIKL